ncbi:MAG: aminotransferase class III-fold pyridoxal phosphate-dependent enzyme [Rhodospirillales bacterium]
MTRLRGRGSLRPMIPTLSKPPELSLDEAAALLQRAYALDGTLKRLSGERDCNLLLRDSGQGDLVLKISAAEEAPGHLDLQVRALRHLEARALHLPVPRILPSSSGAFTETFRSASGTPLIARLVTFLPGQQLAELAPPPAFHRALGSFLAELDAALSGFFHPAAKPDLIWDIERAPALAVYLDRVAGQAGRSLIAGVLARADGGALASLSGLRGQIVHMDATQDNVLADPEDTACLAGLFDFGDMMHQALVVEPAIAAAETMQGSADPLAVLRDLVLGFDAVTPLTEAEVAVLHDLVALRLAMSCLIRSAGLLGPEEQAKVGDAAQDLVALDRLETAGPERTTADLKRALRLPGGERDLLARRQRVTAPAYEHFYREPLHLVRGEGALLFDAAGGRYIDAYNNVPHVGHGNRHVVNAMTRQAAKLNINTRYLTGSMVDYAERLSATLPEGLTRCLFVSSGSEANDIAWRMAWAATKAKGALVMEGAYHGVTDLVARLSPSGLVRDEPDPDFLRRIDAPYPYRNRAGDVAGETQAALASLDRALVSLEEAGLAPAALMVDLGLTNNGVLDLPPGYLAQAVARVRAAGGLFVADEVQAGFARSGESFWRFRQEGLVPDIVTLGKAIGNGFPLAAVVTTEAIAQAFTDKYYFFSSCGGNPVACAAGLAVLDCLEREGLQENAQNLGRVLKAGFQNLASRHPAIGEVRGQGFLLGIELVREGRPDRPAADLAVALVEDLRDLGILVGTEGPDGNVVKVRPPMVLNAGQADEILAGFDRALTGLEGRT